MEIALILGLVSDVMALCEDSPYVGTKTQGVREYLKDDVPVLGAIALIAQCGEAKGMRCVVREIESALERQYGYVGIYKPCLPGADQSPEFLLVAGLRSQVL